MHPIHEKRVSLQIQMAARTRQAMELLIRNCLDAQADKDWMEAYVRAGHEQMLLKEFCTAKIMGPRQSGHSSAVRDLRESLAADLGLTTVAFTAIAANEVNHGPGHPILYTRMSTTDKIAPAEILFVDNAFAMAGAKEGRIYAFAKRCREALGRVVIVLVQ